MCTHKMYYPTNKEMGWVLNYLNHVTFVCVSLVSTLCGFTFLLLHVEENKEVLALITKILQNDFKDL